MCTGHRALCLSTPGPHPGEGTWPCASLGCRGGLRCGLCACPHTSRPPGDNPTRPQEREDLWAAGVVATRGRLVRPVRPVWRRSRPQSVVLMAGHCCCGSCPRVAHCFVVSLPQVVCSGGFVGVIRCGCGCGWLGRRQWQVWSLASGKRRLNRQGRHLLHITSGGILHATQAVAQKIQQQTRNRRLSAPFPCGHSATLRGSP